jgi:hypothetical protein
MNDENTPCIKKWEYRLLVEFWDHEKGGFYWADNETDPRDSQERLAALNQQGWETVMTFPCGARLKQHNYLLKRPVDQNVENTG